MGIRQTLAEKPAVAYGAAGVLIAVAIVFLLLGSGSSDPTEPPTEEFYSSDDGATWFRDARSKASPYEHSTGTAVHAAVFECDGENFVGYLLRYTPEVREQVAAVPEGSPIPPGLQMTIEMSGLEAKRPGESQWVSNTDYQAFAQVVDIKCPDGSGPARPVFP